MTLTAPGEPLAGADISPDGMMVVPAGPEGRVYLYTLDDGEPYSDSQRTISRPGPLDSRFLVLERFLESSQPSNTHSIGAAM